MSEGEVSKLEKEASAISDPHKTGAIDIVVVDCKGYNGTLYREVEPHTVISTPEDLKSNSAHLCYGCERMYEHDGADRMKSAPKKTSSRLYRGLAAAVPGHILLF